METNKTLLKKFARGKDNIGSRIGGNCVIYTSVSSKEQAETNKSLEWQKTTCIDYARKNNLKVLNYFGGTYESAKSDEREEFTRMLKFVKSSKQKIDLILVYSLDRFSRTGDSAIYIAGQLKKLGIKIIAATQPIDTDSHAGALQQNIQFIFSHYDNEMRRLKSIDGMREKLKRGEWIGACPTGYSYVKGAEIQTIVVNKTGRLIKRAFELRAGGMTYEEITTYLKKSGLNLPKQTLTDIFRNVFYCGYLSHTFLNGEVIKGNHPPLISETLFLNVNQLQKTSGFKQLKNNDNLPLKVFVKDYDTTAPFTGYLVRKKKLYYYKVNKPGVKVNRSQKLMHNKFKELLLRYSIKEDYVEPVKDKLTAIWEAAVSDSKGEKISLAMRLKELDSKLSVLEERFAFGEINRDVFEKFSAKLIEEKRGLETELGKISFELSNPQELIDYFISISMNLPSIWDSSDYSIKTKLQYLIFPEGIWYDAKIEHYRTIKVNSLFALNSHLTILSEENKKPDFSNFEEKSGLVPGTGLEPVRLTAHAPQTCLSTSSNTRAGVQSC